MDNAKPWYASKTLWFNVLGGIGAIFAPGGMLGFVLGPEEVGAALGVGNIILRFLTDKKIVG